MAFENWLETTLPFNSTSAQLLDYRLIKTMTAANWRTARTYYRLNGHLFGRWYTQEFKENLYKIYNISKQTIRQAHLPSILRSTTGTSANKPKCIAWSVYLTHNLCTLKIHQIVNANDKFLGWLSIDLKWGPLCKPSNETRRIPWDYKAI